MFPGLSFFLYSVPCMIVLECNGPRTIAFAFALNLRSKTSHYLQKEREFLRGGPQMEAGKKGCDS